MDMKGYIFLFFFCFLNLICSAQKVVADMVQNGVELIRTDYKDMKFADDVSYSLQMYTDGQQVEYFIALCSEENKAHSFLEDAKLLIKTKSDKTIELVAFYSEISDNGDNRYEPIAFYPISESDLKATFDGVVKVRAEMLSIDKDCSVYNDVRDNKKDMGKDLKKMYEAIQKQLERNRTVQAKDNKAKERSENISEGF